MKPTLIAACLAATLALPVVAHEPEQHPTVAAVQSIDAAAAPVIAVVKAFSTALKAGDLAAAGTHLAEDVLILESGGVERSREEYLGGHAKHDAAFLKDAKIDVKARIARMEGNMAWVGTESELRASHNGLPVTLMSTETMVLKRMPAGWQIVHIHWSSGPKR